MKYSTAAVIALVVLEFALFGVGCGNDEGSSKQAPEQGGSSSRAPQPSSPETQEAKRVDVGGGVGEDEVEALGELGAETPTPHPSIPKEQIPTGIADDVREEIEMLYTTAIGQFGALDLLGQMGERAAPAVPFIVSLLHSEAAIEVRSGSGLRFYNGQGEESDLKTMSETRVAIGTKAVEALVKIGKPSVDCLIKSLDTGKPVGPATDALRQITGQDFGTDVGKWKAWHAGKSIR